MRHFDTHGIKFIYKPTGGVIRHQVNPRTAEYLVLTCGTLADLGVIEVVTLGIRNNRLIRGAKAKPENTSAHSDGLWPDYKAWPDGTNGCRALDIVSVKFKSGLVIDCKTNRKVMIDFCEAMGWTVLHKTPLKSGDHIHIETRLTK